MAKEQRQTAFDEQELDSPKLLAALGKTQQAKIAHSTMKTKVRDKEGKNENEMVEALDALLASLELEDGVIYRCGQYVITPEETGGKEVTYTTQKKHKFTVKVDKPSDD